MQWSDEQMDRTIAALLRAGVIIAAAVVAAGGIVYLSQYGGLKPHYRVFRGEPGALRSVKGILKGVFERDSRSFIQLGLLLLIATHVTRVVFSVFAFAAQRDWTYVLITLIVLAILLYSLSGA